MISIEHGTILLVLTHDEAQLIVHGLDEILENDSKITTYKQIINVLKFRNYIEERINEVENNEIIRPY